MTFSERFSTAWRWAMGLRRPMASSNRVRSVEGLNGLGVGDEIAITWSGDCDNDSDSDAISTVTFDSLDSMLEVGRQDHAHFRLAPEAYHFAQWWAAEGAEEFVRSQPLEARPRARRLWLERYTAEQARVRIERARMCTVSVQSRQGAKEEIIGLYFLCRCIANADHREPLPYAAAKAIFDFLSCYYPAMREITPEPRHNRMCCIRDFDTLHPLLQLRMGIWRLAVDFQDLESNESKGSDTTSNTTSTTISDKSTGSFTLALKGFSGYVHSLAVSSEGKRCAA